MSAPSQPGSLLSTAAFGYRAEDVEVPHIDLRPPSTSDVNYPVGKRWIYQGSGEYTLLGKSSLGGTVTSNWLLLGAISGGIASFAPDDGTTPVVPNGAGLVTIAGAGNEITTTGGLNTLTIHIPATFITPGSIASTTTLTAGSSLAVTTSATIGTTLAVTGITTLAALNQTGTTNINISGSAITRIGNGGTGAVIIGNATGNTSITGSLTVTTSITSNLGAITATNGNLVLVAAGNKMLRTSVGTVAAAGANSIGSVVLVGGTVTVATTAVTASSLIQLTRQTVGATGAAALGELSVGTIVAGTSFVINSWQQANATALQATDVSVVNYEIIN